MVFRRIALFFALIVGMAMTQLPEYAEQYRQRLGGAIDELSAIVARFDSDSQQQGLTEQGGLDRLHANSDSFVQQRGTQMQELIARLQRLSETQKQMQSDGPVGRLATLATHYDEMVASRALQSFEPALPVSIEAIVLGVIGFVFGGGLIHLAGRPFRRKQGKRPRAISHRAV
ncbi:DUF2937 family protein [Beijerinckia sp. L45]|uniref:DUF2937 family protein n=1 Tax=Beijerinckia sp. L45 TaxID=1641855 RepID=UPI00131CDF38|nr:DUF2937 family protein [Beijerinckia sp. L45]